MLFGPSETSQCHLQNANPDVMTAPSSTTLRTHEGKSCDAVIRLLERRYGRTRTRLWSPERARDADPVEFMFELGAVCFAMEHTVIEPYAGHIQASAQWPTHGQVIVDLVAGRLPPGETYELHLPVGAFVGLKGSGLRHVQQALADFVVEAAPGLPIAPPGRYVTPIQKYQLPGVPFPVAIHRVAQLWAAEPFTIVQLVDHGLEQQRELRLRQACAKKFPKLAEWKRKAGARAVLVLEVNEINLTNPEKVWAAYSAAAGAEPNPPDEVYLVMTMLEDLWWAVSLRIGDKTYYDLSVAERVTEFKPADLVDLSALSPGPRPA